MRVERGQHCSARELDLCRKAAADYGQLQGWEAWQIAQFETDYANYCEEHGLEYVGIFGKDYAAEHGLEWRI